MRHLVLLILCVIGIMVICVSGKYSASVQNFGKHNLCQTRFHRKFFQHAILANACPPSDKTKNTGVEYDFLMTLMVDTLCKDTGGWLEKWVREYVDYDRQEYLYEYGYIKNNKESETVHHFARHGLCSHTNGKVRFYKALGKHFQNISATMMIYFVLDLCERKDEMLDSWVKEIFDKDGDGFISHFEKDLIVEDTETI